MRESDWIEELDREGARIREVVREQRERALAPPHGVVTQGTEPSESSFEVQLERKYGPEWRFKSLTEEELAKLPVPSKEEILAALERGQEASKRMRAALGGSSAPSGTFYR